MKTYNDYHKHSVCIFLATKTRFPNKNGNSITSMPVSSTCSPLTFEMKKETINTHLKRMYCKNCTVTGCCLLPFFPLYLIYKWIRKGRVENNEAFKKDSEFSSMSHKNRILISFVEMNETLLSVSWVISYCSVYRSYNANASVAGNLNF